MLSRIVAESYLRSCDAETAIAMNVLVESYDIELPAFQCGCGNLQKNATSYDKGSGGRCNPCLESLNAEDSDAASFMG